MTDSPIPTPDLGAARNAWLRAGEDNYIESLGGHGGRAYVRHRIAYTYITALTAALAQRDAQIEPLERAIRATRHSLTEHARYDVLTYLTCEVDDPIAADVWHELAITKFETEDPHA